MDVYEIRRKRLAQLREEYGTQTALAEKVGVEQNYISRCLSGAKKIAEEFAARVEAATGKPTGWLSRLEKTGPTEWPFEFDRRHWDALPPEEKALIERSFRQMVLGAEADVAMKRGKKKAS